MADEKDKPEKSPFAEFQSEEYDRGELIEPAEPEPEPEAEKEAEAPVAEDDTPQPAAEDESPEPRAEGEQPAPKPKTAQERINEITRARREAERVAEAEKRRADAAERKAQELEARLSAPPKKEEPAVEVEDDPDAPKPDAYEYGELDSRYIRDLARFEADRRFSELRQQDQEERRQRAQQEKQTAARAQMETMIERGSKVHEDFYEKVIIGSEKGEWPMSDVMGEMVLGSEVGNEIAYHLATNPQEADRVFRSSPVEQARYFGRMEMKFSAEQAAAPGTTGKPAPKTPKAPAPVHTARGAGGQFHATADTDDFAAFEARANKGS